MAKGKKFAPDNEKNDKAFLKGTARHFNNTGSTEGMMRTTETFQKTTNNNQHGVARRVQRRSGEFVEIEDDNSDPNLSNE